MVEVREALEATIEGTYGSNYDRRPKSECRFEGEARLKAKSISEFLQNVDDDMPVCELRDQLDEIWNRGF